MTTLAHAGNLPYTRDVPPKKTTRLEIRLTDDQKQLIEAAALLEGMSVTEFALRPILEAAGRSVSGSGDVYTVSPEAYDAFVADLEAPATPNLALRRLFHEADEFLNS